jgi:hypothetical protein
MKLPQLSLRDLFWLVALVAMGCGSPGGFFSGQPALLAEDEHKGSKEEIEGLIAQLVSPNMAPDRKGANADYPDDFDRAAQAKVKDAWFKLYDLGPEAFPYLIPHLDDKRYCLTEDNGFVDTNWTVGRACSDIIACHLKPYGYYNSSGPRDDGGKRWYRPAFPVPRNVKAATEWWQKNKGRSLREMQIESIEWVIAQYQKRKEGSDGDEQRLAEMLAKLKAGDKPLKPSFPFAK